MSEIIAKKSPNSSTFKLVLGDWAKPTLREQLSLRLLSLSDLLRQRKRWRIRDRY